jgi:hypothetical protein
MIRSMSGSRFLANVLLVAGGLQGQTTRVISSMRRP